MLDTVGAEVWNEWMAGVMNTPDGTQTRWQCLDDHGTGISLTQGSERKALFWFWFFVSVNLRKGNQDRASEMCLAVASPAKKQLHILAL